MCVPSVFYDHSHKYYGDCINANPSSVLIGTSPDYKCIFAYWMARISCVVHRGNA